LLSATGPVHTLCRKQETAGGRKRTNQENAMLLAEIASITASFRCCAGFAGSRSLARLDPLAIIWEGKERPLEMAGSSNRWGNADSDSREIFPECSDAMRPRRVFGYFKNTLICPSETDCGADVCANVNVVRKRNFCAETQFRAVTDLAHKIA
jgi:hypothetical protein